nr:IS66 family insertion sequence element accessory protein TnpB [Pedobacter sp. SYSU D00823]
MFSLNSTHRYFLYQGYCDMRKSFDGLCGLVISELNRNATSGDVFVFLNRQRTYQATALGTRRLCIILQTPGTRQLSIT